MLNEQNIQAALAVERKMYTALCDLIEITSDLSNALSRQDQVSFQLFLGMRQDSINLLSDYRDTLKKQCNSLSPQDGDILKKLLSGVDVPQNFNTKQLVDQVNRNQALLNRAIQSDRFINQRLCGKKSFYSHE